MATYLKIKTKYNNVITLLRDYTLDAKTIFNLIYGTEGLENYDLNGSIELMYYPEHEKYNNSVVSGLKILLNEYRNNLIEEVTDETLLSQLCDRIDCYDIDWYDYCGYYTNSVNKPFELFYNNNSYLVYGSMTKNSSGEYNGFEGIREILCLKQN